MNAKAQPLAAAEPITDATTELAIIPAATALAVLTDQEKFDAFYARVKAETDAHVPDLTTAKGREAIKSLAFKVVKTKTAIDAAGKALTEEWRAQTTKVDAARKAIRDKLDALRDEVRKPLTEWEEAEEKRVADCQAALSRFKAAGVVEMGESAADVSGRLADLEAEIIDEATFQELAPLADAALEAAKNALRGAVARLSQEEADRAELERLRAQEAARAEAERIAREDQLRAEAAATAARIEAEAAERRQAEEAARAQREQEAREKAAAEAAATAQAETERRAQEAMEAAEAAHRAELARVQREADDAAAARAAQDAEARRIAEAEEARAADRAHRGRIMGEAKAAIIAAGGIGEDAAKKIVLAIKAGEIPNVAFRF